DLPNYSWNHSTKYWHESESSKDWRFRPFPHHELLGTKIFGTPWSNPSWKKTIDISALPWIKDHKMGEDIIFPAAGYMAMAVEAMRQMTIQLGVTGGKGGYKLRNVEFHSAIVLSEKEDTRISLTLNPANGTKNSWYEFRISSLTD